MQLSDFVAPRQMALQAVFVAPLKLVRQRRSVTPVARIVHEIQAGLVFARRWRDTIHLSRQVKRCYKQSQRRSVTPVALHRAQNPGGSGFREEVARHNTLVAPIEPALQAVLKLLVLQFDFICP